MEALFQQHFRAEVADEGAYYHAGYHDERRRGAAVKYGGEDDEQKQSAAQGGAGSHAVFEHRPQAGHRDNVAGGFHPVPAEHEQGDSRERYTDREVNKQHGP